MSLRVGVSQIENTVDVAQNLKTILDCLSQFEKADCDIAVFPECALTGFSSLIKNTDLSEVKKALEVIETKINQGSMTALVPTALQSDTENRFLNSGFYFEPNQKPVQFFKEGLTESEQNFFVSIPSPLRYLNVKNYHVGILTCIEAAHSPWQYLNEGKKPDVILWPAYWGKEKPPTWDQTLKSDDSLSVYENNQIWKTPLILATYFGTGQSLVVTNENKLEFAADSAQAVNYVVTLNKNPDCTKVKKVEIL